MSDYNSAETWIGKERTWDKLKTLSRHLPVKPEEYASYLITFFTPTLE